MIGKAIARSALAAALLFAAFGQVHATTYTLNLTDTGSVATYNTPPTSGWSVELTDGALPTGTTSLDSGFTLSAGDTVDVTINLSGPYSTAPGTLQSTLTLQLDNNNPSQYTTTASITSETITLSSGGSVVYSSGGSGGSGSGGNIVQAGTGISPSTPALSFDSVTFDLTVGTDLNNGGSSSMLVDDASLLAQGVDATPVPVPAALLLFGPGLAGLAVARRRLKK